jgi:tetratricopeptide (TPR) repeat protein
MQASDPDAAGKYDAALSRGLDLLADRKWDEALAEFETARSFKDTPTVQAAIGRVKQHLEEERSAERVAIDIQALIEDGRAEEAAKLATDAVQQFSETRSAEKLMSLKRQADALVAAPAADKKEPFNRLKEQYLAAKKENNLRAAALALEQALELADDADLKKELDGLRNTLSQYDELRAKAAETRKDPSRLEEAVDSLQQAAKLWDTPDIQREIDECNFALQNRHDRLAVASFEMRGDVGIPQAGALVANELLPLFQGKYDLLARSQLAKATEDLKLPETALAEDDAARRELGQLAKTRYLVVGNVNPVAGITVQARMVEVASGLVVQTAEITAANWDDLKQKLPELARVLMMSDDDKQKFQEQQAKNAAPVEVLKPADNAPIPPPPQPPAPDDPIPNPIMFGNPKPPPVGNLQANQFQQLPPQPAALVLPPFPLDRDSLFRQRTFWVALQLGDNLFLRGRFRQALWYYQLCLNLFPEELAVRQRVDQCILLVPFDPFLVMRPRIAVFDFQTFGNALVVPPWLGPWTAHNIAPYFSRPYEVVWQPELFWWMWQLGISYQDVLFDPVARWYLAQVLNVRYFLFGTLVETASFNATTYLVDAQYGFLASSASIHVRTPAELRMRLGELARLTLLTPAERLKYERDNAVWDLLFADIRQRNNMHDFAGCRNLCLKALRLRPGNIEILAFLEQMEREERREKFRAEHDAFRLRHQNDFLRSQQRQLDILRATDVARLNADRLAAHQDDAERRRLRLAREQAVANLLRQARALYQQQVYLNAIALFEAAVSLQPNDDAILLELAMARARSEEIARLRAADQLAVKERPLRERRERELETARQRLEQERQQHANEEAARRKFQEDHDRKEFDRLMDLAQRLAGQQKLDQALLTAQQAKQLRSTPDVEKLLNQLLSELALINAQKKGPAAKAELERQLTREREQQQTAGENRHKYEAFLMQAQKDLPAAKFEAAIEQFNSAKKLFATDAVLTGLRQAESGLARQKAQEAARKDEIARKEQQPQLLKKQIADAESALAAKNYGRAIDLFHEVQKLDPKNETILLGLTKAERAREQDTFQQRRKGEDEQKKATFQTLLDKGKANLAAKNYQAALLSLTEAGKLFPENAEAKAALAEAESKLGSDAKATLQRKAEQYQKFLADGRLAMKLKYYDQAMEQFRSAVRLVPGDMAAESLFADAQKAKAEADAAVTSQQQAARKKADLANALIKAKTALAAGRLDEAVAASRIAAEIDANNADVVQLLADIRRAQDAKQTNDLAMTNKRQQFNELLIKADQALTAKKYNDAKLLAEQARKLFPDDPKAADLLARISKGQDSAGMAERQAKVKRLLADANTASAAKRFDDAAMLLAEAAQLAPNDPAIAQAQAALKQSQGQMSAYTTAMADANKALLAKRYDDALKDVATALKVAPGDKDALGLQKQIQMAKTEAMAAQNKEAYGRLMQQARTAFAAKNYNDAAKAAQAALALFPNDADATRLLADIKKAMQPPAIPPLYAKQMDAGAADEKQGRYDLALKAYSAALQIVPNDDKAKRKVDFCQAMVDGNKALAAKKYPDAVNAFETALKLFPNDANAKQGLTRAKSGK